MSAQINKLNDYLKNKEILILGYGREGSSSYRFLRKLFPNKLLSVADKKDISIDDNKVHLICGEHYLDNIGEFDVVLKSPGISFKGIKVPLSTEITCQTDLFLRFCSCKTIGITGTKGKTTTSTLIHSMLKEAGFDACLIGNIGVPVFEDIDSSKTSIAVIEMSSHQLEFTRTSPHIAVLTNVYEEHLDHYDKGFEGYVSAKLNIVKYQKENDYFIYNKDQDLSNYLNANKIVSNKIPVGKDSNEDFLRRLGTLNTHLKGSHNRQDVYYAVACVRCLGVSNEAIERAIEKFEGIEHRLEFVGSFEGVDYYNDSIATIPKAVICNIEALNNVGTLIIGGFDRGLDYSGFANELNETNIDNIICLPDTGHIIGRLLLEKDSFKNIVFVKDLPEAVKSSIMMTPKGKACLLSPAAASYNVYRDFEEKGRHFKQLIKEHFA